MKLEAFCLKLMSFPVLAKFVGWKFRCSDYDVSVQ